MKYKVYAILISFIFLFLWFVGRGSGPVILNTLKPVEVEDQNSQVKETYIFDGGRAVHIYKKGSHKL